MLDYTLGVSMSKIPSTWDDVMEDVKQAWYKEHLDDSEIDGHWQDEYIKDNYHTNGKGTDETKFIYKGVL